MQINNNKNMLFRQADICAGNLEHTLSQFESDLNYIFFSDDITSLFSDSDSEYLQKLKLFYTTYNGLIKNIDIYDNNKNVFNLFRDRKNNFIADGYLAQRQRKLIAKENIKTKDKDYQYILPVFKDNKLYANILVTVNLTDLILSELNKFQLEDVTWQWVIDQESKCVCNTSKTDYDWNGSLQLVLDDLNKNQDGLIIHTISNDSINKKILSVYTPIQLLDHKFGIGFSIDHSSFIAKVFSKLVLLGIISIALFLGISFYFIQQISLLKKKIKD